MREIRLCTYSVFQLDAPVSPASICMDDFDNDGEDELAIGTAFASLHVLKRTGPIPANEERRDDLFGRPCS